MEETRMTPQQKRELREKLVDSIIEDSRAFNDFSRSGIKDLFNFLMPGYKSPSRNCIKKILKRRYFQIVKNTIDFIIPTVFSFTTMNTKNQKDCLYNFKNCLNINVSILL